MTCKELDKLVDDSLAVESESDIHLSYPDIEDESKIINFYKLQRKSYKYAVGFFHLLSIGSNVYPSLLPIVFLDGEASHHEAVYNPDKFRTGNGYTSNEKQAVIYISLPRVTDVLSSPLKRQIRHELIHYYLWLMDLPCDDDSALFWAYCNIYNGGAYEKMDKGERAKYKRFVEEKKKHTDMDCVLLQNLADTIILGEEYRSLR